MANRASLLATRPPVGNQRHPVAVRRGPHGPGSPLYEAVIQQGPGFEVFSSHFMGGDITDAVASAAPFQYQENNADGTDFAKLTPTAARPSHGQMSCAATSGRNVALVGQTAFLGEQNCWFEVWFDLGRVTDIEVAMGFVDGNYGGSAADVLGDIDTPTFNGSVADAAVIGIDTAQTLATAALVAVGTSTSANKVDFPTAAPYGIPTVNTTVAYRVELRNDKVFAFVNGALQAEATGPDTATLLAPIFLVGTRTGTSLDISVDYIEVGQETKSDPVYPV